MSAESTVDAISVTVKTMTLAELCKENLIIPGYQRPYSWQDKHVKNLLKTISQSIRTQSRLLLGTVIVYTRSLAEKQSEWEIIDGQQRMVTLQILTSYILASSEKGAVVPFCDSIGESLFMHNESQINILRNRSVIKDWWNKQNNDNKAKVKCLVTDRIDFVVVSVPTLDEAFIFFNSQNNRGKRLSDFDLIKANHLRFIADDSLQKCCAESWEKIERAGEREKNKDSGYCTPTMKYLMQGILGRARQSALNRSGGLLEEFRCQRSEQMNINYYVLSNYVQPAVFGRWRFDHQSNQKEGGGLELVLKNIDADQGTRRLRFESDSKRYMPFQIPQSIEGGEQFFWFIEKYHAVYNDLFVAPVQVLPAKFIEMMIMIREMGGHYVRKFYEAVLVFYYDKFGCENPEHFMLTALYLQFAIYDLQSKQRVQERSVNKFMREVFNPFLVIHEASTPAFIWDKINEGIDERRWYRDLSEEGPAKKCRANMMRFYNSIGIQPDSVVHLANQLNEVVLTTSSQQ